MKLDFPVSNMLQLVQNFVGYYNSEIHLMVVIVIRDKHDDKFAMWVGATTIAWSKVKVVEWIISISEFVINPINSITITSYPR